MLKISLISSICYIFLILSSAIARAAVDLPAITPGTCTEIAPPSAIEPQRVALVIGNSAYTGGIPQLRNPGNDANGVVSALHSLGFSIFALTDGTGSAMRKCAERAKSATPEDAVAIVYYSGHGIQIDDRNYMIATDAAADGDLSDAYVYIDDVIDGMREKAASVLVFLDACRNNPFAPEGAEGLSVSTGRGLDRGLKKVAPSDFKARQQARGIFVAYSTSPNAVATDGVGSMSPFTEAFVNTIGKPGYSVQRALSEMSKSVGEATDWSQTPWIKSSLTAEIHLNGGLTTEEAQTLSEKYAGESYKLLARGDIPGAIEVALKGLPLPLSTDAETRFARAYNALVAATRSTSYRLPLVEEGWAPSGYSALTNRVIGSTYGEQRVLALWDTIKGTKIADLATTLTNDGADFAAVMSPDGERVAAYIGNGRFIVVDAVSGTELRTITIPHVGDVSNQLAWLRFGPDSRTVVAISSHLSDFHYQSRVQIFDGEAGEQLFDILFKDVFAGDASLTSLGCYAGEANVDIAVSAMAFSCMLNKGFDETSPTMMIVGRIDLSSQKLTSHSMIRADALGTLVDFKFRSDAKRLTVQNYRDGVYGRILFNMERGEIIGKTVPSSMFYSSFSPDGTRYFISDGNRVDFYSSDTGVRVGGFDGISGDFVYPGIFKASGEVLFPQLITDDVWWTPPKGTDLVTAALARLNEYGRTHAQGDSLAFKASE